MNKLQPVPQAPAGAYSHKWKADHGMTRSKAMLLIVSMMMCFTCLTGRLGTVSAEEQAELKLQVRETGSGIQIVVSGQQLKDLYAYDFIVHYNTRQLKFEQSSSSIDGFSVDPIMKNHTVRIAHTTVGNVNGLTGNAELAVLNFTRISKSAAAIQVTDIKWVDSKLNMTTAADAFITIPTQIKLTDIGGHWAETSIQQAVNLGFAAGYADGTFKPQREVTRAEFTVMLVKALGMEINDAKADFTDTMPAWAEPYIAIAAQRQIIAGYSDRTFRPNAPISREEIASIAARALNGKTDSLAALGYSDAEQVAAWARPYVAAAHDMGLMQGRGQNLFAPKAATTRAEAVVVILNILQAQTAR
jgi:hypothetical protein